MVAVPVHGCPLARVHWACCNRESGNHIVYTDLSDEEMMSSLPMDSFIHMQNFPSEGTAEDIRKFFAKFAVPYGGVEMHGGPLDSAFIALTKESDLTEALLLNQQLILGVPIKLVVAKFEDFSTGGPLFQECINNGYLSSKKLDRVTFDNSIMQCSLTTHSNTIKSKSCDTTNNGKSIEDGSLPAYGELPSECVASSKSGVSQTITIRHVEITTNTIEKHLNNAPWMKSSKLICDETIHIKNAFVSENISIISKECLSHNKGCLANNSTGNLNEHNSGQVVSGQAQIEKSDDTIYTTSSVSQTMTKPHIEFDTNTIDTYIKNAPWIKGNKHGFNETIQINNTVSSDNFSVISKECLGIKAVSANKDGHNNSRKHIGSISVFQQNNRQQNENNIPKISQVQISGNNVKSYPNMYTGILNERTLGQVLSDQTHMKKSNDRDNTKSPQYVISDEGFMDRVAESYQQEKAPLVGHKIEFAKKRKRKRSRRRKKADIDSFTATNSPSKKMKLFKSSETTHCINRIDIQKISSNNSTSNIEIRANSDLKQVHNELQGRASGHKSASVKNKRKLLLESTGGTIIRDDDFTQEQCRSGYARSQDSEESNSDYVDQSRYVLISNAPRSITENDMKELFQGQVITQILVMDNHTETLVYVKFLTFQPTNSQLKTYGINGKYVSIKVITDSYFQRMSLQIEFPTGKGHLPIKRDLGKVYRLDVWERLVENLDRSSFLKFLVINKAVDVTGVIVRKLFCAHVIPKLLIKSSDGYMVIHAHFCMPPMNIENIDSDQMRVRAITVSEKDFKSVEEVAKVNDQYRIYSLVNSDLKQHSHSFQFLSTKDKGNLEEQTLKISSASNVCQIAETTVLPDTDINKDFNRVPDQTENLKDQKELKAMLEVAPWNLLRKDSSSGSVEGCFPKLS